MQSVIRIRNFAFATLLFSLFVFASQSVQAATLTVSTTADGGNGSLRQAIIDATSNAAANIVNFNIPLTDPGYNSTTNRFTITLVNPLPDLPLAPLTIDNATGRGLTVKGNNSFRIFTLVNSAVVHLTNMTISQGSSGGLGGGIYMGDSAVLFLTNCLVSNNTATNGGGGVWVNDSGTLHVLNSTINNNTATNGDGGGIYVSVSGTLNITSSTVNGNAATVANGGGIFNGVSGTVNATNITVSGNTAGNLGGGIYNSATETVSSSTISGTRRHGRLKPHLSRPPLSRHFYRRPELSRQTRIQLAARS
jgi:predicted outer membrane repeat protein